MTDVGTPYGSAFQPPTPPAPQLLEGQAQALVTASLGAYGTMPDPQLAYQTLMSGATPHVLGAIQSGSPQYQSLITGSPIGEAPLTTQPTLPAPQDSAQSLWSFDWANYWKGNKDALGKDENKSFASFGEVPQLNLAYMQGVSNQQDPKRIKRWQQMLQHQGYLDPKAEISGSWDLATEKAFRGYMISRAVPAALWSKDDTQRNQAKLFLGNLSADPGDPTQTVNTDDLEKMLRDPKTQTDIISRWMSAQGPDVKVGDRSALQSFADKFGEENMPKSYQSLIHESPLDWVRGGLGVLGKIPGLGRGVNVLANVVTGNVADMHGVGDLTVDPTQLRVQTIEAGMTNAEKQAIQPALQQVANDTGFLGVFDAWDRWRTKSILQLAYMFGDAFAGKGFENPFDPNTAAYKGAVAHQDNIIAGLMGDKWAHDHNVLAAIGDFTLNLVDDPLSYVAVPTKMLTARRLSKIRDVMEPETRKAIDMALDTAPKAQREMYTTIRAITQHPEYHGLSDIASFLGETRKDKIADLQKIAYGEDHAASFDALQQGYRHVFTSPAGFWNAREALSMLNPEQARKLGGTRLSRMRQSGAFLDDQGELLAHTDPLRALTRMRQRAVVAGMDAGTVKRLGDWMLKASVEEPDRLPDAVRAFNSELAAAWKKTLQAHGTSMAEFNDWFEQSKTGKSFTKLVGDVGQSDAIRHYAPHPDLAEQAGEMSVNNYASYHLDQMRLAVDSKARMLQETGENYAKLTGAEPGSPEWEAAVQRFEQDPETIANRAEVELGRRRLDEERAVVERPVPMHSGQFADLMHLPWSTYSMVAYLNPKLRAAEHIQSALHLDAVSRMWKSLTLARPATSLRVTVGDDIMRAVMHLAFTGHEVAAGKTLARSLARSTGVMLPVARKRVLKGIDKFEHKDLFTNFWSYLRDADQHVFVPYEPTQRNYARHATHFIDSVMRNSPEVLDWARARLAVRGTEAAKLAAARAALEKHYVGESGIGKEFRRIHGDLAPTDKGLQAVISRHHEYLHAFSKDPQVLDWLVNGVDRKALEKRIRTPKDHAGLPRIVARREGVLSQNLAAKALTRAPEMLWEKITEPMIAAARQEGFLAIKDQWEKHLRSTYKGHPHWDAAEIDAEATGRARAWMLNNTYQMQRTVMGSTVRNIFPFWGATSNMARFFLRQGLSKPFLGNEMMRSGAWLEQQAKQPGGQAHIPLPSFMEHLGFGGGDSLDFNPSHMFFFTSDGLASFVPGFGPLFSPVFHAMAKNQHLAEAFADIPGLSEQIDINSGQAKPLWSWFADVASGAGMALTGKNFTFLPGVLSRDEDYENRLVDSKIKQVEASGKTVTPQDIDNIRRSVGSQLLTAGVLNFGLPIQPQITDKRSEDLRRSVDTWRGAGSDQAKDDVIAKQLGVSTKTWQESIQNGTYTDLLAQHPDSSANLMVYFDRRFPAQVHDAISQVAPWVTAYATSEYESADKTPATLQQFKVGRASGNIHLLSPDEYVARITDNVDMNQAWLEYSALKQREQAYVQQTGLATSSQQYKLWRAQYFEPAVAEIENNHPAWAKQFGSESRRDVAGMLQATRPLRTLATWEVIPQHSDQESQTSALWRQALVWRDQAAGELMNLRATGGSATDTQMVFAGLKQRMQWLAQQDPTFAAQINNYRYSSFEDLVNIAASERIALSGA